MTTPAEKKEAGKQAKLAAKQKATEEAAEGRRAAQREVEQFVRQLKAMTRAHHGSFADFDWDGARNALKPHPPARLAWACVREIASVSMSSIFPDGQITNSKSAEEDDEKGHGGRERMWDGEIDKWMELRELGEALRRNEPGAVTSAWAKVSFCEAGRDGQMAIDIQEGGAGKAYASIEAEGREVVPTETKILTPTGKLSTKPIAKWKAGSSTRAG